MNQSRHSGSRAEQWTSVVILLCLLGIAAGILLKQSSFNPAVLVIQNEAATRAVPREAAAPQWMPPELKPFGPPESFTPENLYDKIDGKAELYLSAGFVRLNCRRFALKGAPDEWLEWFVYDMGTVPQAFSVFTVQRRSEGRPLDLTEYAYRTKNALYFVSGSNYVEAVASAASEPLAQAMLALARGYVSSHASGPARLAQLDLLPAGNLVPGSYTLQTSDVFGFDQFTNVYTAHYRVGEAEVLAFVTVCANAASATKLRDAYRAFLLANGGKDIDARNPANADRPINIMDTVEIVFSEGEYVAGVHAAPDMHSAATLATELHQRLTQKK